ncbi:MAG: N-acetyltransferase [Bdellovibrionota bacterium]|nr:N-acetyltransferase [Bdellovibrionota bacterium]
MEKITVKPVRESREKKCFVNLPWSIYKNDPNWVPPLKMAVKDQLNPKHPFYETADTQMFLAWQDKQVVGRLMAINPKAYNQFHDTKVGFFGFYEAIKSVEVSKELFKAAEKWCQDQGLNSIMGPFNLSSNYEAGLLVKGFDDPPQIMMTYNPQYYMKHLEENGYTKAKDLLAYEVDYPVTMPDVIVKIAERAEKKNRITYRYLNKADFKGEVDRMLEIYNDAWEKNWGFVPMTEKEFRHTAKDLKTIVDERLVVFAEVDGEPAGFIVGLADLNQVFKTIPSGSLLPTGLFKLLTFKKRVSRMRVPTMGVKKKFRKIGLETLLYRKCQLNAEETGLYKSCEASWILEDNIEMNKPLIRMGFDAYKTYRIYEKNLS